MIAGIVIVAAVLILISLDDVYKEIRRLRNDLKKYNQKNSYYGFYLQVD